MRYWLQIFNFRELKIFDNNFGKVLVKMPPLIYHFCKQHLLNVFFLVFSDKKYNFYIKLMWKMSIQSPVLGCEPITSLTWEFSRNQPGLQHWHNHFFISLIEWWNQRASPNDISYCDVSKIAAVRFTCFADTSTSCVPLSVDRKKNWCVGKM